MLDVLTAETLRTNLIDWVEGQLPIRCVLMVTHNNSPRPSS